MSERQDPFEVLGDEPIADLVTGTAPTVLRLPPRAGQRKTPLRPSEKRRRGRKVTITFRDSRTVERLRNLARQWGMESPSGEPNVSRVVEHLLLPQIEAAEQGRDEAAGVWQ